MVALCWGGKGEVEGAGLGSTNRSLRLSGLEQRESIIRCRASENPAVINFLLNSLEESQRPGWQSTGEVFQSDIWVAGRAGMERLGCVGQSCQLQCWELLWAPSLLVGFFSLGWL